MPAATTTTSQQSEEQRKTVRMVEKWLREGKRARARYDRNWTQDIKFAEGEQWAKKRPSYRHSCVVNLVHSAIQTSVSLLTDNRINVEAHPEGPEDFEFSEIMSHILRSKWDRRQFSQIVAEGIVDLAQIGSVISCQEWDPSLDMGLGDYLFETVDPRYCYPHPDARQVNDRFSKRFQIAKPESLNEVKRRYPEYAHLLTGNVTTLDPQDWNDYHTELDQKHLHEINENLIYTSDMPSDTKGPDKVLLITTYCKPEEIEEKEIEEKTKNGQKVKKTQARKKWPNGRKIVVANGILLEDRENPYLDGKFPYAHGVNYIRARNFWGMSEVEQTRGPQDMINKIMSYVFDVLIMCGNPIFIIDSNSGVEAEQLVNAPGAIVEKNPGTEVRREMGVQLQPFVLQLYQTLIETFEKITGVNEVSQGFAPLNSSGVAVEKLQTMAQNRMRLKGRNVEAWLKEVGDQMTSRILQFYTIPRVVRLTGTSEAARFFKVVVDHRVDEEGTDQQVLLYQEIRQQTDENGAPIQGGFLQGDIKEISIKSPLDIRISTGTSLPIDRAEREMRAQRLFEQGIYDEEDYLNDIEHPQRERILRKLQTRKTQMAQVKALENQAGIEEQLFAEQQSAQIQNQQPPMPGAA